MKPLSIPVFGGLILAGVIIYWLGDLNRGAIALVILFSISFAAILERFVNWITKRRSKDDHKN